MRLLFDENLSHHLVRRLADVFPGSVHVRELQLGSQLDTAIWSYAASHDLVIVSKDDDFHHLSFVRGAPPKVIGIRAGNCTTSTIEALLRARRAEIERFGADTDATFLPL